ncbi:PQQ-binding-like beta-propeller repeat protein [Salarchaeum sp. III]|uniref:PQQ-binding-like beta-propeller repeat protein n=1 Tax=Salarchaeum sp. III TaxID=3107927 RepID=UPI002ED9F807
MPLQRREILAAGMLALSGCSALGRTDDASERISGPSGWESYGRESTHRASYAAGSVPSSPPETERSYGLRGSVATSPVASETHLVVGDQHGLRLVPFADDALARRIETQGRVAATPCLDGERVYVTTERSHDGTSTAHVSAMSESAGTLWETPLSAGSVPMPTLGDGGLFVRSADAYLALDADSGEVRWRNANADHMSADDFLAFENVGPAVGSDLVVFPDAAGITAVDPADGSVRWRRTLRKVRSCPTIADGTVYVSDVRSGVHAFDAATGDREWTWRATGCWSPPAVAHDRVYVTDPDDVVALDVRTGDVAWRMGEHGLHGSVHSGISVVGDMVLASSRGFGLASVRTEQSDGDAGTIAWSLAGDGFNTPIAVGDRIAFVDYVGDEPSLRVLQ